MSSADDVLVIAESGADAPTGMTLELLGLGRRLADAVSGSVSAIALTSAASELAPRLIAAGADRVMTFEAGRDTDAYPPELWLEVIGERLRSHASAFILMGHTALGAELGPRLAFQTNAAIATSCEIVEMAEGQLVATRPCFGNKAREVLTLHTRPSIVTVRPRTHEPLVEDATRKGEITVGALPAKALQTRTRVVQRTPDDIVSGIRLENARIVVAGGRGLGGAEGFEVLEKFAEALGGAVGASRVACDLGWAPHSRQIGMSGKTVTPDLYVAVGISGASHHMAGCGRAKAILAINSDPQAAIFKEARFGIVGDYRQIVPALIEEIVRQRATLTA